MQALLPDSLEIGISKNGQYLLAVFVSVSDCCKETTP